MAKKGTHNGTTGVENGSKGLSSKSGTGKKFLGGGTGKSKLSGDSDARKFNGDYTRFADDEASAVSKSRKLEKSRNG